MVAQRHLDRDGAGDAHLHGVTSKLRQPNTTSSPLAQVIWTSCWHRLTEPQPTEIRSGVVPITPPGAP